MNLVQIDILVKHYPAWIAYYTDCKLYKDSVSKLDEFYSTPADIVSKVLKDFVLWSQDYNAWLKTGGVSPHE